MSQYELLGRELLRYDLGFYRYGAKFDFPDFRTGVATVPVEVLESYLEDLLDLEVSEDKLFIVRKRFHFLYHAIALFGLVCALATGLYAVSEGASTVLSFGITILFSLPFAILWHFAPRSGVVRRLAFAQIVSHEASRRRGNSKDGEGRSNSGAALTDLLSAGAHASSRVQGATRSLFH